jgi:hypothetical protein
MHDSTPDLPKKLCEELFEIEQDRDKSNQAQEDLSLLATRMEKGSKSILNQVFCR